ncbi:LOG family protein [Actinokineospora sp. HUAS TT18]|uniref:LOG family protein n=1 Tax=Actinokineospora sp. HUAS TT18 TaxID=3447451 RepID=UPI003F520DCA
MRTEITDLDTLRRHRAEGRDLRGIVLTRLDLTDRADDALLRTALDDALLLGCVLTPEAGRRAEAAGALVFPAVPNLPYDTYRATLYTVDELFAGFDPDRPESYADTPDALIYRHAKDTKLDTLHALTERLHDHSISEALADVLTGHPVAVMGGHALTRDSAGYRDAVRLGITLGQNGFTVLTGGGPGAMEAVPLGVRLGDHSTMDSVIDTLSAAPKFASGATVDTDEIGRWLAAGLAVDLPATEVRTIGIPTWFYGHEPPNPFCQLHAKYFANSVREDGLLTVATGGIIYTPGSAGTVQEVFQDYTQNHYSSVGPPAPMIFLGSRFWTEDVPAAPLVRKLAKGRAAEPWIMVTDDTDEAVALLRAYATSVEQTGALG